MKKNTSEAGKTIESAIEALCPNCGLCCNGVLFADGELRKSDNAVRLMKAGLDLFRKGRKTAFAQPCSCFDGKRCAIYPKRPEHCVKFECGLLKRVAADEMTPAAGLRIIATAKRKVSAMEQRLRKAVADDDSLPLTIRFTAAMSAPVDLARANAAKQQGRLMRSMDELMGFLQREFLR